MALNSHTSGGGCYWHSILTPWGATGTQFSHLGGLLVQGARDKGATGMTPRQYPQGLTPCSCIICLGKESMLCVCGCSSANYYLLR